MESRKQAVIAVFSLAAISLHLMLRWLIPCDIALLGLPCAEIPLVLNLAGGGLPLLWELLVKVAHRQFGSDLLAGISIITSAILGEYLAGTLVVLMLSGGEALEVYAVRSASSVLEALARRMPSRAHCEVSGHLVDVPLAEVGVGDNLVVFPHEICPVDGTVTMGQGVMDESYLTGEPYRIPKTSGTPVLAGAINGDTALTIRAEKLAIDSRYAKIMMVMRASEQQRPRLRRLGDQLGAFYTPVAVTMALLAWATTGDVSRFLAVLVVATPCPLLIAIPVAMIGAISLAARRGIIIKDPTVLERIDRCRIAIFDKTGTLTYGEPSLTDILTAPENQSEEIVRLVASLERYSKHPLAGAVRTKACDMHLLLEDARAVREPPGAGLIGHVGGYELQVTSRRQFLKSHPGQEVLLPAPTGGLECVVTKDDHYAATFRFRDQPRLEGASFIHHLKPKHRFDRVLLVSGDRESEVRYLAELVGIQELHFSQTPEQKLAIVRQATNQADTLFLGDGINDAPALAAATVGIAFGQNSDITAEAAGAVILESSLQKVDEFFHLSRRFRRIALESAVGGMVLSLLGMAIAACGYLSPVVGALAQEVIDVTAVANALRVAWPRGTLTDYAPLAN
jgi:heavy metal translocating P-type ATPase